MSKSGSTQTDASGIPIKVILRVRPYNNSELRNNSRSVVEIVDDKMLIFDPKEERTPLSSINDVKTQESRNILTKQNKNIKFTFDKIFDSSATNKDIFEGSMKNLIGNLLDGCNCTVFTYGGISSGKTHTMVGYEEEFGIGHQIVLELFSEMEKRSELRKFSLNVTYIEIFNGKIYDLLKGYTEGKLSLKEDDRGEITVVGLKPVPVRRDDQTLRLYETGNARRTECKRFFNEDKAKHSSHAVFEVHINIINKLNDRRQQVKLSMIDLTTFKKFKRVSVNAIKNFFVESVNINKDLLALGNCINKLADGKKHIPYRDSTLTRILKNSLSGKCNTIMIANIGPSSLTYQDTYNTLKYANRAKGIYAIK